MGNVVELRNVSFAYNSNLVLEDINLQVEDGDFLAVIGPNGGGKTTLLRLILGYLQPVTGVIKVFDRPPQKVRRLIGYVPQHRDFLRDFPVTALNVVLMGRLQPGNLFPRYRREDYLAAMEAMKAVSVENLARQRFDTLSGGQKQRILIARALAPNPRMLVLDEPTASVDSRIEQDIYDLLRELRERMTIIIVSHDLGFVSSYVNKVACVNRRISIHWTEEITRDIIAESYQGSIEMLTHHCHL